MAGRSRSSCLLWTVIQLGTMTSLKDQQWPRKAVHLKYTIRNRAPVGTQLRGAMLAQKEKVMITNCYRYFPAFLPYLRQSTSSLIRLGKGYTPSYTPFSVFPSQQLLSSPCLLSILCEGQCSPMRVSDFVF